MTNPDDPYSLRKRLVDAADDDALRALMLDSIEVASVAVAVLASAEVPDDLFRDLGSPGVPALFRPYQPPEEPEDVDDRTAVLEFAASVANAALDHSLTLRERANDAAFVLADLHSHVDGLAADEFADEGEQVDVRPGVIEGGEAYDAFCMRRQNDLLQLTGGPAVRESTDQGKDLLRRALLSLIEADRI
jgi:hypothetical protein